MFESWRVNECSLSSCKKKLKPPFLLPKKILHSSTNLDDSTILIVENQGTDSFTRNNN